MKWKIEKRVNEGVPYKIGPGNILEDSRITQAELERIITHYYINFISEKKFDERLEEKEIKEKFGLCNSTLTTITACDIPGTRYYPALILKYRIRRGCFKSCVVFYEMEDREKS